MYDAGALSSIWQSKQRSWRNLKKHNSQAKFYCDGILFIIFNPFLCPSSLLKDLILPGKTTNVTIQRYLDELWDVPLLTFGVTNNNFLVKRWSKVHHSPTSQSVLLSHDLYRQFPCRNTPAKSTRNSRISRHDKAQNPKLCSSIDGEKRTEQQQPTLCIIINIKCLELAAQTLVSIGLATESKAPFSRVSRKTET